jgi:hypothetical protein
MRAKHSWTGKCPPPMVGLPGWLVASKKQVEIEVTHPTLCTNNYTEQNNKTVFLKLKRPPILNKTTVLNRKKVGE